MKLVYKNEGDLSHLEMGRYFKNALSSLQTWISRPSKMIKSKKDVFHQPLLDDPVLTTLRSSSGSSSVDVLRVVLPPISEVMNRQLSRYLTGDLSNPTTVVMEKTVSAAPHNIWAERVIGMTCHLWKRCPMATAGFLEAKIKAKTNRTMDWLDEQDDVTQERLVVFARRRAGVLRRIRRENELNVDQEIEDRMKELAQARSTKARTKMDRDVRQAFEKGDSDAVIFLPVEGVQRERLQQLMRKDESLIGALFIHTWYDADTKKDCSWNARVLEVGQSLVISYWKMDEMEADAVDSDVRTVELLTDMVLGDVVFH